MVPHLLESIAGKPTSLFSTPHKIYVPLQQVTIWKVKVYYPLHVFPFHIHMKLGYRII